LDTFGLRRREYGVLRGYKAPATIKTDGGLYEAAVYEQQA
jgi:hypothetical protein